MGNYSLYSEEEQQMLREINRLRNVVRELSEENSFLKEKLVKIKGNADQALLTIPDGCNAMDRYQEEMEDSDLVYGAFSSLEDTLLAIRETAKADKEADDEVH